MNVSLERKIIFLGLPTTSFPNIPPAPERVATPTSLTVLTERWVSLSLGLEAIGAIEVAFKYAKMMQDYYNQSYLN